MSIFKQEIRDFHEKNGGKATEDRLVEEARKAVEEARKGEKK